MTPTDPAWPTAMPLFFLFFGALFVIPAWNTLGVWFATWMDRRADR